MAIENGELIEADDILNALGSMFLDFSQNLFNSDYNGFANNLTDSTAPNLDNVFYSTFTSDDADQVLGFEYDSTNDKYKTVSVSTDYYFIIEANDQELSYESTEVHVQKLSSGKWIVFGKGGSQEIRRANIHKALWFGTDGTDQLILDFTNVTSLKVSDSDDVGFRGHYARANLAGDATGTYTGTFLDTTGNTISSWSNLFLNTNAAGGTRIARWEVPSATILHTISAGPSNTVTSDEMGTDLSGDEKSNPATCQAEIIGALFTLSGIVRAIIFCQGDITWVNVNMTSVENIDFFTDNSIPDTTQADSLSTEGYTDNTSTLIFKDTTSSSVTNAIASINSSIDGTSSEQISISANGGSDFTDVNNGEIARPIVGTALWRKLVITRTDLSKLDQVTEQAVKYNFY